MNVLPSRKRRSPRQISWEQILANLDDGVIALDVDDKVIFFNEASEVLTDISSGSAMGQSLEQIFKREPWLVDLVKTTHPPRQRRARGEGDFINRWARKIPVGVTVSSLQDRHGHFVGTILLLRDSLQAAISIAASAPARDTSPQTSTARIAPHRWRWRRMGTAHFRSCW